MKLFKVLTKSGKAVPVFVKAISPTEARIKLEYDWRNKWEDHVRHWIVPFEDNPEFDVKELNTDWYPSEKSLPKDAIVIS